MSKETRASVDDVGPFEVKSSIGYERPGGELRGIEIVRWRPALPFPVSQPTSDGAIAIEVGFINGAPAIFMYPKGLPVGAEGSIDIWWLSEGTLTQLTGGGTLEDLTRVAESIN